MAEAWFRPKRFGYGAGLPIHWKGWALTAGYFLVLLAAGLFTAVLVEPDARRPAVIGVVAAISLPFALVVKAKTAGGWRWRWRRD